MASLRPFCLSSLRSPKRFILAPRHQFRNPRVPLQLQCCYRVDSNNRHELGFPSEPKYQRFPGDSKQQYQRFRKAQPPFYQSQRFWITMGTGGGLIGGYYVTHLETVPVTNRRRFIDVTLAQEEGRLPHFHSLPRLSFSPLSSPFFSPSFLFPFLFPFLSLFLLLPSLFLFSDGNKAQFRNI